MCRNFLIRDLWSVVQHCHWSVGAEGWPAGDLWFMWSQSVRGNATSSASRPYHTDLLPGQKGVTWVRQCAASGAADHTPSTLHTTNCSNLPLMCHAASSIRSLFSGYFRAALFLGVEVASWHTGDICERVWCSDLCCCATCCVCCLLQQAVVQLPSADAVHEGAGGL